MTKKEGFLKNEYCDWFNNKKKKTSGQNTYRPYAECIFDRLFENNEDVPLKDVPPFERDYTFYVPALLLAGKQELSKKLLACVYADVCLNYKSKEFTYFKSYCGFIASIAKRIKKTKRINKDKLTLNESESEKLNRELPNISTYLENRQVWVVEDKIARSLKAIDGGKNTTFKELFNIRINSWGRPNFPLDIIKKVFGEKNTYMSDWVNQIRDNIEVVISDSGERIKLNNIKAFDFRKSINEVWAIVQNEKHIVYTPLANSGYKKMEVQDLRYISIDHECPLDTIVRSIRENESEIQKICDYCEKPPNGDIGLLLENSDIEKLKKELTFVRKATSYVLMDTSQNSSKSNNTPVIQVVPEKEGFKYIVAEDVVGEKGHTYRVYFTDKDKTMRLEMMNGE